MNAKDLRLKGKDELQRLAAELRVGLGETRFKIATRQASKVRAFRQAKRDLARVLTVLAQGEGRRK